jgi:FtsP/CotA-like multicopper oxidase with cupredoxin domain
VLTSAETAQVIHDVGSILGQNLEHGIAQLAFDGFNTDGIIGDRYTANRKVQPKFKVEARKYRIRIYNGGPSRFYELYLRPQAATGKDIPFVVITGDGNYQPSPLVTDAIYLGVAQRVDTIIDFSMIGPGKSVYLVNRLRQLDGRGPDGRLVHMPRDQNGYQRFLNNYSIMRFDIGDVPKKGDPSLVKVQYRDLPPVDLTEVRRERIWEFDTDGGLWTVNNRIYDPNRIDAQIEQDTAEVWTIRNSGRTWHHPIHSHFTEHIILEVNGVPEFQAGVQTGTVPRRGDFPTSLIRPELIEKRLMVLLNDPNFRQEFYDELGRAQFVGTPNPRESIRQLGQRILTDQELAALAQDVLNSLQHAFYRSVQDYINAADFMSDRFGITIHVKKFMGGPRRDIVLLLPGSEVKIFMRWKDFRGKYVMHCHNVVHEDHAMMIRWDIIAPDLGTGLPRSTDEVLSPELKKPHMEPHPGQATAQDEAARKAPKDP